MIIIILLVVIVFIFTIIRIHKGIQEEERFLSEMKSERDTNLNED